MRRFQRLHSDRVATASYPDRTAYRQSINDGVRDDALSHRLPDFQLETYSPRTRGRRTWPSMGRGETDRGAVVLERHLHVSRLHQPSVRSLDADAAPGHRGRHWGHAGVRDSVHDLSLVPATGDTAAGGALDQRPRVPHAVVLFRAARAHRCSHGGVHRGRSAGFAATEYRSGSFLLFQKGKRHSNRTRLCRQDRRQQSAEACSRRQAARAVEHQGDLQTALDAAGGAREGSCRRQRDVAPCRAE